MKKKIGAFLLMLSVLIINSGTASAGLVGIEEMPESIKKLR